MNPIAISAIHEFHENNNAILAEVDGWMLPKRYAAIKDEYEIVENFVGIHDISSKVKLILHGDNVFEVLSEKFEVFKQNRKVIFMRSFEYGFEFILAKLTKNQWLLLADQYLKNMLIQSVEKAIPFVDITSGLTGIRLIGPKSRKVMNSITTFDIRDKMFPDLSVAQISLMHQHAYLVRADIEDKLCYQIFVGREIGLYVWNQIIILGNSMGVAPIGNQIMDQITVDGGTS